MWCGGEVIVMYSVGRSVVVVGSGVAYTYSPAVLSPDSCAFCIFAGGGVAVTTASGTTFVVTAGPGVWSLASAGSNQIP
jgi:hypothetical protein